MSQSNGGDTEGEAKEMELGKPFAGKPLARFDEGRKADGHWPFGFSIRRFPPTLLGPNKPMHHSRINPNTADRLHSLHRIHCLDGIRASAALMVMVFHFVGHHGEPKRLVQAAVIGQTGVDLFFVLSGFLITRILLLSKDSPHFFRTFYARRTLRIFPLYYAFLIAFFFLLPAVFKTPVVSFGSQIWAWCYLQNLPSIFPSLQSSGPGHFWSLAVEEHFYLVWPLLVFISSRKHFTSVIYGVLLIALSLRFLLLHLGIGVFYFTFTRMDALGYGALLAVLLTDEATDPSRYIYLFRSLVVVLALLLLPSFTLLSGSRLDWLQALKLSLIPAFYFALLGFCIVDPLARPLATLFSLPWLRWLGAISYGLYVFHPTCFALVERFVAPSSFALDVSLSFALTVLIAFLSFRFFESPLLKLKRYFHYETVQA